MQSLIVVHPDFDKSWPFAADHFAHLWQAQGPLQFVRLADEDRCCLGEIVAEMNIDGAVVQRLVALHVPVTSPCLECLPQLKEAVLQGAWATEDATTMQDIIKARGIKVYAHTSEGYWGQSVSEFALALTLCGLRRIPQTHHEIITDHTPWDYNPPGGRGRPGGRGHQFGDDVRFSNGTVEGKRVRIVGAGNIASRYASFVHMLGAEVATWDPFASEPCFHRTGARREWHLDRLVQDAEIFAPMLPLTESTRGLVTREHIEALPQGCLVVLATRARICDMEALRERVLADELALAADVFDVEPLPFDDPLLGRHNVVHTPHNAGRTRHANEKWAEALAAQFAPYPT